MATQKMPGEKMPKDILDFMGGKLSQSAILSAAVAIVDAVLEVERAKLDKLAAIDSAGRDSDRFAIANNNLKVAKRKLRFAIGGFLKQGGQIK